MKKVFNIFNKTIEIELNLIQEYEEKVGSFNDKTLSYLAITLELDENMSTSELETTIEAAMKEDCNASALVKEILSNENKREELFNA